MEVKDSIDLDDPQLVSEIAELNGHPPSEAPEGIDPALWDKWTRAESKEDDFLYQLNRGVQGLNVGLGNGLQNVNKYIYGTHHARYYLIGADSSVGKTTLADFMFVLQLWENAKAKGKPIKIFYCSFEVAKTDKKAKWVSYYLFLKFGIRLPSEFILGRIDGVVPNEEQLHKILIAYHMVEELMKDIIFHDHVVHPTAIFEGIIENHYEKIGTVTRFVTDEEKKSGKKGYVIGYKQDDPNIMTVLLIDHLALTGHEMKLDTKGIMDKMSRYFIVLRNLFGCTCVGIQQFSTDLMSFHRTNKKNPQSIAPQRIDFGDSKATFRDADVVFGILNPITYDFDKFEGYQLIDDSGEGLGQCFRGLYLMKNRYGPSGRLFPLFMDGLSGYFYDLPLTPNNPLAMTPWYNKANEIESLCQVYSPKAA